MLDIGFLEITIVFIVAVLALGPDKLPKFTMDAVKMFKAIKKTITNAQDSIETEINIADMQEDMQKYQDSIMYTENEIKANNSEKKSKKEIKKLDKTLSNKKDKKSKKEKKNKDV